MKMYVPRSQSKEICTGGQISHSTSCDATSFVPGMRKPLYPVEQDAEPATVCVTGGTGYIAGAIIARLLAAGHTVHATVRDPNNEQKLRWLNALPQASSHLKFFKVSTCAELMSLCQVQSLCPCTASCLHHPSAEDAWALSYASEESHPMTGQARHACLKTLHNTSSHCPSGCLRLIWRMPARSWRLSRAANMSCTLRPLW